MECYRFHKVFTFVFSNLACLALMTTITWNGCASISFDNNCCQSLNGNWMWKVFIVMFHKTNDRHNQLICDKMSSCTIQACNWPNQKREKNIIVNENAWALTYLPRFPQAQAFCPIVLLAWWTQTHTHTWQTYKINYVTPNCLCGRIRGILVEVSRGVGG